MEKRIKRSILFVGVFSFLATAILAALVMHAAFDMQMRRDTRLFADAVALAYASGGDTVDLGALNGEGGRVTLLAPDGSVLFESGADQEGLENQLSCPEVQACLLYTSRCV